MRVLRFETLERRYAMDGDPLCIDPVPPPEPAPMPEMVDVPPAAPPATVEAEKIKLPYMTIDINTVKAPLQNDGTRLLSFELGVGGSKNDYMVTLYILDPNGVTWNVVTKTIGLKGGTDYLITYQNYTIPDGMQQFKLVMDDVTVWGDGDPTNDATSAIHTGYMNITPAEVPLPAPGP